MEARRFLSPENRQGRLRALAHRPSINGCAMYPNFSAHRHPYLAVTCPTCGVAAGRDCNGPTGSRAIQKTRAIEAEALFLQAFGPYAAMMRDGDTWLIDRQARRRD